MAKRIGLVSLGCAKNLVNSEQMLYLLNERGYDIADCDGELDAVVINTCGFIDAAKSEAIDTILDFARRKKAGDVGKIVVAGCLPERYRNEIMTELPEIDAVVGVGSFNEIADAVSGALNGEKTERFGDVNASDNETGRILTTPRAWAYLKIAEGCDNRCAYCVIPDLRGHFRSRPIENLTREAREMVSQGVRELIVVAQDITRYGADLYGGRKLSALLSELCKIDELRWIRLHYLYPDEIDDELIGTIASNDKVLKYLDIPIQHISDRVLGAMRRRGTGGDIRRLFTELREKIPGLVLRTSLITGLPYEGASEFEELCDFLREYKIERAGVFPYSPEEGTDAEKMDRPDEETALHRAKLIENIQSGIMDGFNAGRIGGTCELLVEGSDGGRYYGRTYAESPEIDGYVFIEGRGDIAPGDFMRVRITGDHDGELTGEEVPREHGE